jgi:membrane-associated phospholipid phosphatase
MNFLIDGDKWLFELINSGLGNPLFDALLPLFREKLFWMPLYLFIGAFSLLNYGKRGWLIVLGIVVTAGLADFSSSTLIKKNVQRTRPCNAIEMQDRVQLRVDCGGGYSFTSSHAANHFAVAVFLIGVFGLSGRWQQKALLGWAGLIAFSQVYVGVHYPFDVLCGAGLGWLAGDFVGFLWRKYGFQASVFGNS